MGKGNDPNVDCTATSTMSDLLVASADSDPRCSERLLQPDGSGYRSGPPCGIPMPPSKYPGSRFFPDGRRRDPIESLPLLYEHQLPDGRLSTILDNALKRELASLGLELDADGKLQPTGPTPAPGTLMGSEPVDSATQASAASLLEQVTQPETGDEPQQP